MNLAVVTKQQPINSMSVIHQQIQVIKVMPVLAIKKAFVVLSILSVIAATLTGIMTWANLEASCSFFYVWGKSFVSALFVMMPVAALIIAILTKLVKRFLSSLSQRYQNLIIGFFMAILMQSVMAIITTFNAVGYSDSTTFSLHWAHALMTAFPIGLAFALLMTTVIKPRLEAYVKSQ